MQFNLNIRRKCLRLFVWINCVAPLSLHFSLIQTIEMGNECGWQMWNNRFYQKPSKLHSIFLEWNSQLDTSKVPADRVSILQVVNLMVVLALVVLDMLTLLNIRKKNVKKKKYLLKLILFRSHHCWLVCIWYTHLFIYLFVRETKIDISISTFHLTEYHLNVERSNFEWQLCSTVLFCAYICKKTEKPKLCTIFTWRNKTENAMQ